MTNLKNNFFTRALKGEEKFWKVFGFIIFLFINPVSSLSQNQSATIVYNNHKVSNDYTEISTIPKILKDKSGNKYELNIQSTMHNGIAKFNYSIAKFNNKKEPDCLHLKSFEDKVVKKCQNDAEEYYRKWNADIKDKKRIIIFSGYYFSEERSCDDDIGEKVDRITINKKYLIKDFNNDNHEDIGFKFTEMNCKNKKLTTYEKILFATKEGFELQEKINNN